MAALTLLIGMVKKAFTIIFVYVNFHSLSSSLGAEIVRSS